MATTCPYCKSPIHSTDERCPKCRREIEDNQPRSYSSSSTYETTTSSYDYDNSSDSCSSSSDSESCSCGD